MEKIYALLTADGTACAETALHESEYTPENRARVEAEINPRERHPPVPGTWIDVSENEAFWAHD